MRAWGILAIVILTASSTWTAGCNCYPQRIDATVTGVASSQEARSLPIIASGGTRLLGIDVPDSHGLFSVRLELDNANITRFEISGLRLTGSVDGATAPLRITNADGLGRWGSRDDGRTWYGEGQDGSTFDVHWTLDRDRLSRVTDLNLREGAPYALQLEFSWLYESCAEKAAGTVRIPVTGVVAASVNAQNFESKATPMIEESLTGVGLKADFTPKSGLSVKMAGAQAVAAVLPASGAIPLGVYGFTSLGWTVDGASKDVVAPGQTLRVQSKGATGLYAASGQKAPPGLDAEGGLVVLIVRLEYTVVDGTPGATTDVFAFALTP
jgi:hypothetical protein